MSELFNGIIFFDDDLTEEAREGSAELFADYSPSFQNNEVSLLVYATSLDHAKELVEGMKRHSIAYALATDSEVV